VSGARGWVRRWRPSPCYSSRPVSLPCPVWRTRTPSRPRARCGAEGGTSQSGWCVSKFGSGVGDCETERSHASGVVCSRFRNGSRWSLGASLDAVSIAEGRWRPRPRHGPRNSRCVETRALLLRSPSLGSEVPPLLKRRYEIEKDSTKVRNDDFASSSYLYPPTPVRAVFDRDAHAFPVDARHVHVRHARGVDALWRCHWRAARECRDAPFVE
jgi:hypothetical protein